jgi:hypothetical protein
MSGQIYDTVALSTKKWRWYPVGEVVGTLWSRGKSCPYRSFVPTANGIYCTAIISLNGIKPQVVVMETQCFLMHELQYKTNFVAIVPELTIPTLF